MKLGAKANIENLEKIMNIDYEVIGNTSRRDYIENAIELGHCIIAKNEENDIEGFLIYDFNFFECFFITNYCVTLQETKRKC